MFRRVFRGLSLVKATNVLTKTELKSGRHFSELFPGGKPDEGNQPYHVKLLEVKKRKEDRIMELTANIESLQMKIKALKKVKSAEAKSALAEMEVILKDLKDALRKIRIHN